MINLVWPYLAMHLLIVSHLFLYFSPVTAGEILTKKLEMDQGRNFSFILPYFDIPRYADKIMMNKTVSFPVPTPMTNGEEVMEKNTAKQLKACFEDKVRNQ